MRTWLIRMVAIGVSISAFGAQATSFDEARRLYDRTDYAAAASKLSGAEDAPSLRLSGQSYFMLGDFKRATGALEKALAVEPTNSVNYLWLGRIYGRRAETAFPLAAPSLANKARENFEKAVSLDSKNWEAISDLFEYYVEAPGFLGGGTDKAARLAELIAAHDPAEAAFARARIAEQKKQFDSAEALLRRAAQLAPHQVGRLVDLGRFLAKRGRYDESDQTFQQAFKVAPNAPKVYFQRAHSLIDSNRNLPEARDLLKKYLTMTLSPEDPSRRDAEKLLKKVSGS